MHSELEAVVSQLVEVSSITVLGEYGVQAGEERAERE